MATEMADDTGDVEGDVDQDESVDVDADAVNGDSPSKSASKHAVTARPAASPMMGKSSTPIPAELEIVCGDSRPSGL